MSSSHVSMGNLYLQMPQGGYLHTGTDYNRVFWGYRYGIELGLTKKDVPDGESPSDFWKVYTIGDTDQKNYRANRIAKHLGFSTAVRTRSQRKGRKDALESTRNASWMCRKTFTSETKDLFDTFKNPDFRGWIDVEKLTREVGNLDKAAKRAIEKREKLWDDTVGESKGYEWVEAIRKLSLEAGVASLELFKYEDASTLLTKVPEGSSVENYDDFIISLKKQLNDTRTPPDWVVSHEEAEQILKSTSDGRWDAHSELYERVSLWLRSLPPTTLDFYKTTTLNLRPPRC